MPGLMSRMARLRGGQADPLDADLKKITESGVVEVPQELFALVVESTHDADSRRKIMAHLRSVLSEVAPKRWKRVYCGLLLAEQLLDRGSVVLMIETAQGHHFDLLQKISFLEHFQLPDDKPTQHMVRKKAADLRNALVPRLTEAAEEELPQDAGLTVKDTISCGTGASNVSTSTGSTGVSSSAESTGTANSGKTGDESQPSFWARSMARVRGGTSPLQQTLTSITESAVIDIPKELLQPVVEKSHDKDNRKEIMQHVRGCLTEPSGAKWRRTYAGLVLLEGLVQHGDRAIVCESSQGLHFDLVQQLSFLEQFEYSVDRRAQNLIRRKATALQQMIPQKLQDPVNDGGAKQDDVLEASAKQQESAENTTKPTNIAKSYEGGNFDMHDFTPEEPKGQLILNGIVTVGHNDDTTSESSGGEGAPPVRRRDVEHKTRKTKSQRNQAPAAPPEVLMDFNAPAPPMQASNVDLLDF